MEEVFFFFADSMGAGWNLWLAGGSFPCVPGELDAEHVTMYKRLDAYRLVLGIRLCGRKYVPK